MTLAEIRAALGASGVADAIRRALTAHATITAAAASLGTTPYGLRRAAKRVGVEIPEQPRTPGKGVSERTERRRRNAAKEEHAKKSTRKTG